MSEDNCIFCRILAGEIPSTKVYEDRLVYAFRDANPQAPTHVLLVPKEHIESLNDAAQGDEALLGHMLRLAPKIANQEGLADSGFRTVINTGGDAGQTVWHLHVHVLGGRPMTWPPG
ncbi:MAG: histidine triad nucleotide-binding protein [Acidobacteria bacterium]|nr:histidine triad nucleotide-binding protein [Acidobacteriota bacterium]